MGRRHEARELAAAVANGRLCTVVGPAGAGKSRLVEIVRAQLASRTVTCELAAVTSPLDLPVAVFAAVDLPPDVTTFEQLGRHLASSGWTLILDNCEHLASDLPAILGPILAAGARVVVTSRVPLEMPGEWTLALGPLLPAEARTHFRNCCRSLAIDEQTDGIDELLGRLDHLPLAIRLAAARLAWMTPRQLVERLATLDAAPDHAERALDISWMLLDERQRDVLVGCAAFPGSFTLEAAEAVLRLPGAETATALEALQRHSLVHHHPSGPRLELYDSVRHLARRRARTAVDAARTRVFTYYGERAGAWWREHGGYPGATTCQAIADERHNLIATTREAARSHRYAAAMALNLLGRTRGNAALQRDALERAAAAAASSQDRAAVLVERGFYHALFDQAAAIRDLDEALAVAGPGTTELVMAHIHRARLHLSRSELELTTSSVQLAADIAESSGLRLELGRALGVLGPAWYMRGRRTDGEAAMLRAILLHAATGDDYWHARTLFSRGSVFVDSGRFAEAIPDLEEACRRFRSQGDVRYVSFAQIQLALAELAQNRPAPARAHLDRALEDHAASSGDMLAGRIHELRGLERLLAGAAAEAEPCFRAAIAIYTRTQQAPLLSTALAGCAVAEAHVGHAAAALAGLQLARQLLPEPLRPLFGIYLDVLEAAALATSATGPEPAIVALAQTRLAAAEQRVADHPWGGTLLAAIHVARRAILRSAITLPTLRIARDAAWFQLDQAPAVSLATHGPLRLILRALVKSRLEPAAPPLAWPALLRAGWPDEPRILPQAGKARVHGAIATLRRRGLRTVLRTDQDGYRLDLRLQVEYVRP